MQALTTGSTSKILDSDELALTSPPIAPHARPARPEVPNAGRLLRAHPADPGPNLVTPIR